MQSSIAWDPDGAGPEPRVLVIGGYFHLVGETRARSIARFDPATGAWSPLGAGLARDNDEVANVSALAVLPNGDLLAGGDFRFAGGAPANHVARWNGSSWSPLGSGTNLPVYALTILGNGDVVAGGDFTSAGGAAAQRLARWDGTNWTQYAGGVNVRVLALAMLSNGQLAVGGSFSSAGGLPCSGVATWNGSTWSNLGGGLGNSVTEYVYSLAATANGGFVAGGNFTSVGGVAASRIARWNGTAWQALAAGTNTPVHALAVEVNGDIVAGGDFVTAGGVSAQRIARWNGTTWTGLGGGTSGTVHTIARWPNGDLFAGGTFTHAGAVTASSIARWDGIAWSALATGTNHFVNSFVSLPDGDVVAVGNFTMIGGVQANHVARYDGTTWTPIGTGLPRPLAAAAALPNGNVVVAEANHPPPMRVSVWDGTSWSQLGSGMNGQVTCLVGLPNGDIVAGGTFTNAGGVTVARCARWNGTSWSPVGSFSHWVNALATLPNGHLAIGGYSWSVSPNLVIWNGTSIQPFPSPPNEEVTLLRTLTNGDLLVGGVFTAAGSTPLGYIGRWNGSVWSTLGGGLDTNPTAAVELPNGDLAVGHLSVGPTARLRRWNGTTWSDLGDELTKLTLAGLASPRAMALLGGGDLLVSSNTHLAGAAVSAYVARLTTTCPAGVTALGTGCPSSGGNNELVAELPWAGSNWSARATGLPANAFAFLITGFAPVSVPLSAVFPTGVPGCTLHVQPDFVALAIAGGGAIGSGFALPNSPSLAGASFHHQVLPLALDPSLAITATNAVTLTIGVF